MQDCEEHNLIITDLHRSITGVSATVRTLIPYIDSNESMSLVSPHPHSAVESIGLWQALKTCLRRPRSRPFRIWHARRNNEMLWGLIFKYLFRCKIRLVMTSCALRRHSWFPRQLLRAMDGIIATSEHAASYVPNVVATIPHGIDTNRFRPVADRQKSMRQFGIPGNRAIGICGRIRPEKGTDLFVEAMIRLLPQFPDFTACIAGRATLEHESLQRRLSQKIESAGLSERILWMGEIDYDQMPQFLASMSLCVAPARYEGFGLVPLEAMACGVPVVASRTGCYEDLIVPGVCGELVSCNDLEMLTAAVRRVMSAPEKIDGMGQAGRDRVLGQYSARSEADRIIEVYHRMWKDAA